MPASRTILRAGLVGGLAAAVLLRLAACGSDPVIPAPTGEPDPGWTLVNPRPFNLAVTAVWGLDLGRMVAGGAFGRLAMLEHGVWQAVPSPAVYPIQDIHGCDWQHIWAVSQDGLLRFDGKGWRWVFHQDLGIAARIRANAPDDVMLVWRPWIHSGSSTRPRYRHFDGAAWSEGELDIAMNADSRDFLAADADGRFAVCGSIYMGDGGWQGALQMWEQGAWRPFPYDGVFTLNSVTFYTYGDRRRWVAAGGDPDQDRTLLLSLLDSSWGRWEDWDGDPLVRLSANPRTSVVAALLEDRDTGAHTLYQLSGSSIDLAGSDIAVAAVVPAYDRGPVAKVVLGGGWSTLLAVDSPGTDIDTLTAGIPLHPRDLCAWPGGDFAAVAGDLVLRGRAGALTTTTLADTGPLTAVWGPSADDVYVAAVGGVLVHLRGDAPPDLLRPATDRNLLTVWGRGPADVWTGGVDVSAHFDGSGWSVHPWPLSGSLAVIAGGLAGVFAMSQDALGFWDGRAWAAAGPDGAVQFHGLAVDRDSGDPVIIARLDDGGPRRVMRRTAGVWEDLGVPGDVPRDLSVLDGSVVSVMTDQGWYVREDGRWRPRALPESGSGVYATLPVTGSRESGLFVSFNTGGLHHLALQGVSPWR